MAKPTTIHETVIWDSEPVVGEFASGRLVGQHGRHSWDSAFSGIYEGVIPSEWDGEPMHMFRGGFAGTTPQGRHGFPVHRGDR